MEKKSKSTETVETIENIKKFVTQIKKDYNKNQKGINSQIAELKTAISSASDSFESFSQNSITNNHSIKTALESISENINSDVNRLYSITDTVNIDINKLSDLVDEFKTNTNSSNQTMTDNMVKIENMLSEYNTNLAEINNTPTLADSNIKEAIKSLNDDFYLEILNLFNNLSFEDETEDLKDFMEGVLSAITVKTDENSEKLNNIMLQFKNLLNKIERIEKTQNSISDYLKPEDTDNLMYSFDDIQSDLAKMRLVLNDISNSVSSYEAVDEISDKIRQTNEQIENVSKILGTTTETDENVSKILGTTTETDENVTDIRNQIESLNNQIYDISMRTNKLILTNEDSTLELKNNLEIFKEVFDKANPEKIYELFYELTHYFNDVNEKIIEVTQTTKAAHKEAITIKNALSFVGNWLDSATSILNELQENSIKLLNNESKESSVQISDLTEITSSLEEIKQHKESSVQISDLTEIINSLEEIKQHKESSVQISDLTEIINSLEEIKQYKESSAQISDLTEIINSLEEIKQYKNIFQVLLDMINEIKTTAKNNIQIIGNEFSLLKTLVHNDISTINEKISSNEEIMNNQFAQINAKLDLLLQPKTTTKKATKTTKATKTAKAVKAAKTAKE